MWERAGGEYTREQKLVRALTSLASSLRSPQPSSPHPTPHPPNPPPLHAAPAHWRAHTISASTPARAPCSLTRRALCCAAYAMDGCATFFKRDKFALVKKYEVEFNKVGVW